MRQSLRGCATILLTLAPISGVAQDRVRIVANGSWNGAGAGFSDSRSYTEFAETATLGSTYATKSVVGPDLGVQLSLWRRLGVFVAFSAANRDESATFQASLPHPLYLNRPRSLSGDLTGYQHKETAFHVDLAFAASQGRLDYALFAGISRFNIEADIADTISYTQLYPYDDVTLNRVASKRAKDTPAGFNAGGRLDYRFGAARRFGLGVQVRISGATAKLKVSDAKTLSIDAGGFQAGIGARLYF